MDDVRDSQRADGNIPAVVPQPRKEFDETGVDALINTYVKSGQVKYGRRSPGRGPPRQAPEVIHIMFVQALGGVGGHHLAMA